MILTNNNNDGFVNLFNGLDHEGWCMAGPGRFQIIKQERALESEDGMGLLWYTKRNTMILYSKSTGRLNAKTIIQVYLSDFLIQAMIPGLLLIQDMRFR